MLKFNRAKLRELMLNQGLGVTELAKLAGVSATTVSELFRQDRRCFLPTVTKLAKALGVEPTALIVAED